jgi:hypothetical protein
MQKISSVSELKNAIQLLEVEHDTKEQLLKDQFYLTCESLKPVNILKNTLINILGKIKNSDGISDISLGVAGGLLLRNLFVGSSENIFRKITGSFLQLGITNLITQHSDLIKSVGHGIIQFLFGVKEANSRRRVRRKDE